MFAHTWDAHQLKNSHIAPADMGPDWRGGFYCPCHGSKFDLSGRVFSGVPAPSNLRVPAYRFENESILVVGESLRGNECLSKKTVFLQTQF